MIGFLKKRPRRLSRLLRLEAPPIEASQPPHAGAMVGMLVPQDLAEDSHRLLDEIRTRLIDIGAGSIGDMVHITRKDASQHMLRLIEEISQRLAPPQSDSPPEHTSISALVSSLREQLQNRPLPPAGAATTEAIEATPKETEATIAAGPGDKGGGKSGGKPRAEQAATEALGNPFSLVNIQRGAALGAVMTKDTTLARSDADARRQNRQATEGASVAYHKKLAQPRFSRRRFLRDYRGTNLLTVIVLFFVLIGVNIGTIVANVSVLIPQTIDNQRTGAESQTFLKQIEEDQPKLSSMLDRRQKMNQEVAKVLEDFSTVNEIREAFANFIGALDEDPAINLISQQINEDATQLPNVSLVTVTLELEASFLLWLKLRNKMVRDVTEVNITDEVLTAPPGVPEINIQVTFSKPGRTR